jgi:hypothetical protein
MIKKLENINLPYLYDNVNFRNTLTPLSPCFKLNFETATREEYELFFYNLLKVSEYDLSLAHCLHHNHKARVAIQSGKDSIIKDNLEKLDYHEVVGCYSGHRAIDTVRYDSINNTITAGTKSWISNLKSADMCVFEVTETHVPLGMSAYTNYNYNSIPNVYVVYVDLTKISHTITDGTLSPTAAGMTGASPGTLTINTPIKVDGISCSILEVNPRQNKNLTWLEFTRQCWATQHFGMILGLYKELKKYPEAQDPSLSQRFKAMELEISSLKIMWEYGVQTKMHTSMEQFDRSAVISNSSAPHFFTTQYALSKKVLLDLIYLVLEIGINDFIDTNTIQWVKLKDAISFVTHMTSLSRCHSNQFGYNNF